MSRRVLIIDDEANVRRMMRLAIESDGYEVEDAPDGKTGLEMFGDGSRFDAVVLDQKMPGMDGIETLRLILKKAPAATVIMATAFGSIELAVDAMKAGARDFLKKPLTPALLRRRTDRGNGKTAGGARTAKTFHRSAPSATASRIW